MPEFNVPPTVTPPAMIRPVPTPPPPEPEMEQDMMEEQESPRQVADDGISDLFETGTDEQAEDLEDLFDVDDEAVGGDDMSDLFDVSEGDVINGPANVNPPRLGQRRRRMLRRPPPPAMGGMQGIG